MYVLMRDEEGRKKEASKVKQTTRQSNIAYPRQSLFQRKNELPLVGHVYMHLCIYSMRQKKVTIPSKLNAV